MGTKPFEITSHPAMGEQITVFQLTGPLTITTMFPFQNAVRADERPATIIEMTEVPYVDSAGVGVLVNAHVSRQRNGRKMCLVGLNPRVRELMRITKVDSVFPLYETMAEAEAAMSGKAAGA